MNNCFKLSKVIFIMKVLIKKDLAKVNKKMQDSYSSKYDVSINSMLCSSGNLGIVYDIKDNGITTDIQYMLLYSLDNHKLETIACRSDTSVERADFYLWSIVLLRTLSEEDHSSTEWLSLLADSMDGPNQVGDYYFKLDMGDENYMFVVLPK